MHQVHFKLNMLPCEQQVGPLHTTLPCPELELSGKPRGACCNARAVCSAAAARAGLQLGCFLLHKWFAASWTTRAGAGQDSVRWTRRLLRRQCAEGRPSSRFIALAILIAVGQALLTHDWLQVLERIKDPLMTLVSRDHYETAYTVICHFLLIVQRAPVIFSQVGASSTLPVRLLAGSL